MGGKGSGRKPRQYPEEIVDAVKRMYLDEGMTVLEIQQSLPAGYKAQRIIERHIPVRRKSAKRNQLRDANSSWRGDSADYRAVHMRLRTWNGPAHSHACVDCGSAAKDWSYDGDAPNERLDPLTGCPYTSDLSYYHPRCRSCHRQLDKTNRTNRKEVSP